MNRVFVRLKEHIKEKKNHNKVIFGKEDLISNNCVFEGGNRLSDHVTVLNSTIGWGTYISAHSEIVNTHIGRFSCIGDSVKIVIGKHPTHEFATVHPAFYSLRKQAGFTYVKKQKYAEYKWVDDDKHFCVRIGSDCWIGSHSVIMQGVTIGDGAVIAAGAVVTKDVEPYNIVGGVPAKMIDKRYSEDKINELLDAKWWDRDIGWIRKHADSFESVEELLNQIANES
ncbi:MAG: antibiotic acetyltransferase [Lachnospiraceae bacterium]|nr:antibiotic acetyltransferase [Lachnospiraceae bacterium]